MRLSPQRSALGWYVAAFQADDVRCQLDRSSASQFWLSADQGLDRGGGGRSSSRKPYKKGKLANLANLL